jgi:hypothetical protein
VRFLVTKRLNTVPSFIGFRSNDRGLPDFELTLRLLKRYDTFDIVSAGVLSAIVLVNVFALAFAFNTQTEAAFLLALATLLTAVLAFLQRLTPKEQR